MKKLEDKIYELLLKKNYKIATAESCTGGLLASTIINVPGASNIIEMSFVTYSNEAKEKLVNVSREAIKRFGVVSEKVAQEMAKGAMEKAKANVGLSTTGLAGPKGDGKLPVGTVCFGICINDKTYTYTNVFKNISRSYIRKSSVKFILKKLLLLLEESK